MDGDIRTVGPALGLPVDTGLTVVGGDHAHC